MSQRGPDLKLDEWEQPVLESCAGSGYGTRVFRLQWCESCDGDSFSGPSGGMTYGLFGHVLVVGTKVCILKIRST